MKQELNAGGQKRGITRSTKGGMKHQEGEETRAWTRRKCG